MNFERLFDFFDSIWPLGNVRKRPSNRRKLPRRLRLALALLAFRPRCQNDLMDNIPDASLAGYSYNRSFERYAPPLVFIDNAVIFGDFDLTHSWKFRAPYRRLRLRKQNSCAIIGS